MTTDAITRSEATPFAGLVPAMASMWRRLRDAVAGDAATREQERALHLIEFVASRFGDPLLEAASLDDLDDRLDDLVDSPDALHCTALLARHVPALEESEATSAAHVSEAIGDSLGVAQGRAIAESEPILDAWLDAQRQAATLLASGDLDDMDRIPAFSLTSPEIPAEIARLIFHSLRAALCSMAIARATALRTPVEPWLARALTERLVTSAKEHLRLLASIPGVVVDEAIVPPAMRLDLKAIEARHHKARMAAQRSLEQARARHGL